MANYPQYQYQPQQMGFQPQMQPVYQQYQQPPMQQQPQQDQLYCRPVASADEARAVPVDFSGRPMILPHLSAGRIYVKAFDPGSGSSMLREFRVTDPEPPAAAFAPMAEVETLKQNVAELRNELIALKGGREGAEHEV